MPIKTGVVAFGYSLRTAILPFFFIFNTDILLIDVGLIEGIFRFIVATIAILLFTSATQGYLLTRNRFYETLLLLLIAFTFFRPGFWMNRIISPYVPVASSQLMQELVKLDEKEELRIKIQGEDELGDPKTFYAVINMPKGQTPEEKLDNFGLETIQEGNKVIVDMVGFGSMAEGLGFQFDQQILSVEKTNTQQPLKEWLYLPALLLLGVVIMLQRRRVEKLR